MEYHSIKIQIITKEGKKSTREILQTFSLTEAQNWLNKFDTKKGEK